MKKFMIVFGAIIIAAFVVISCKTEKPQTADDIKIEDIKSACDCLDASIIIGEEMLTIYESIEDLWNIEPEKEKRLEELAMIGEKLDRVCFQYEEDEMFEECANFDKFLEIDARFMQLFHY